MQRIKKWWTNGPIYPRVSRNLHYGIWAHQPHHPPLQCYLTPHHWNTRLLSNQPHPPTSGIQPSCLRFLRMGINLDELFRPVHHYRCSILRVLWMHSYACQHVDQSHAPAKDQWPVPVCPNGSTGQTSQCPGFTDTRQWISTLYIVLPRLLAAASLGEGVSSGFRHSLQQSRMARDQPSARQCVHSSSNGDQSDIYFLVH